MRKILILTLAIVCGVAFSDAWAKRPKKNQPTQESISAERDSALQALKDEMKAWEDEMERKEEESRARLKALKEEIQSTQKEVEADLPCVEEAVSNDEYFAAWGVSDAMPSEAFAMQTAMFNAKQELVKLVEENMEINNVEVICQRITRNKYGAFTAYVAIRVPKKQ